MAWQNGSALSQTVFICLYVDKLLAGNPESLDELVFKNPPKTQSKEDRLLLLVVRAYILGITRSCNEIIAAVNPYMLEVYTACAILRVITTQLMYSI